MGTLSLLLLGIGGIGCAFSPPINPSADFEWFDAFPVMFLSGCLLGFGWIVAGLVQSWGLL